MNTDTRIFNNLDRAFWLVWGLLPLIAGVRIYFLFTSAYFNPDGSSGGEIPIMAFSLAGKIVVSAFLCVNVILYIALLAYMHILVRQFRRNSLFVDGTLQYMQRIALLMVAWPFIKTVFFNFTSCTLVQLGDVPDWKLQYELDLPLISAGLVILALRLVVSHAIKLHQDAQYTV